MQLPYRRMTGHRPDKDLAYRPTPQHHDEPKAADLINTIRDLNRRFAEPKDVVRVSPKADDETRSRVWQMLKDAVVKQFPPTTGVSIEAFDWKVRLARGRSRLYVKVTIKIVPRVGTLNLDTTAYIWDLNISRGSDSYAAISKVTSVLLVMLFIATKFTDDFLKLFLFLLIPVGLFGLIVVGYNANRRGHADFPPEQVRLLEMSLNEMLAAELGQNGRPR